jgi:hypothetical protein
MDSPATPPPLPPQAAVSNGFHIRNWMRNGMACRITVVFAMLACLNLFESWEPDYRGAGYSQTQWEGNEKVRREYSGTSAKGGGNAFTAGQGWIPFIGLAGILYVCGRPRRALGGLRWVPLAAGILIFACVFDEFRDQEKEREAWLSKFASRPVVVRPAAMQWVIIFSFGMIISGAFFARRPKDAIEPRRG